MIEANVTLIICIPTKNRLNWLKDQIDSIERQSFTDYLILILDNASNDGTKEYFINLQNKKIKYFGLDSEIPTPFNFNRAFLVKGCKYLSIIHDDDLVKEGLFSKQIDYLSNNQDIMFVATNIQTIDVFGKIKSNEPDININEIQVFEGSKYLERNYLEGMYLPMPTVMFNFEKLKKTGVEFSDKVGPNFDQYFWFQLEKKGAKFALLPDVLYLYRRHSGQLNNYFLHNLKLDVIVYSEFYENKKIRRLIEKRSKKYYLFFHFNLFKFRNLYYAYRKQGLIKRITVLSHLKLLFFHFNFLKYWKLYYAYRKQGLIKPIIALSHLKLLSRKINNRVHFLFKTRNQNFDSIIEKESASSLIIIGNNFSHRKYCILRIFRNGILEIGDRVFINSFSSINCFDKIKIGDDTMIGEGVKIYDHNHTYQFQNELKVEKKKFTTSPVIIGKNCWIASNVTILKGVTIGDNVIIGAGCLIHKSIPSNSIVKLDQNLIIDSSI